MKFEEYTDKEGLDGFESAEEQKRARLIDVVPEIIVLVALAVLVVILVLCLLLGEPGTAVT